MLVHQSTFPSSFPNPAPGHSTFVDMHGERDELVRRVFNELNTRLRDRWVEVVPVDLRWGTQPSIPSIPTIEKAKERKRKEVERNRIHSR